MKKRILLLPAVMLLCILGACTVYGDEIYSFLNPVRNDWILEEETGHTYYLNDNSDPVTGWLSQNGNRYYLDPVQGGARVSGWAEIDGLTYHFEESGAMTTGWMEKDGRHYYFQEEGSMATGWKTIDGVPYFFNQDGSRHSGWLEEDGIKRYLAQNGTPHHGWLELDGDTYYLDEDGIPCTGWVEAEGIRYYMQSDGKMFQGWLIDDGNRYYLKKCGGGGVMIGWLELDGKRYYFKEDGTAAVGMLVIDGQKHFFSSSGVSIPLVNHWNPLLEGYEPELTALPNGREIAVECYEPLMQMMADCEAAGCDPEIIGAYRSWGDQRSLYHSRVAAYEAKGLSKGAATYQALQWVALPGTSEHQLGLAVDILDSLLQ